MCLHRPSSVWYVSSLAPGVSRSVTLGTKMYISTYSYRSEVENRLRRTSDLTIISSTIRDEYLN